MIKHLIEFRLVIFPLIDVTLIVIGRTQVILKEIVQNVCWFLIDEFYSNVAVGVLVKIEFWMSASFFVAWLILRVQVLTKARAVSLLATWSWFRSFWWHWLNEQTDMSFVTPTTYIGSLFARSIVSAVVEFQFVKILTHFFLNDFCCCVIRKPNIEIVHGRRTTSGMLSALIVLSRRVKKLLLVLVLIWEGIWFRNFDGQTGFNWVITFGSVSTKGWFWPIFSFRLSAWLFDLQLLVLALNSTA